MLFGGALLANALPHLVNGVSGRVFPTPFARPPGRGTSSTLLNVIWGAVNLAVGYVLLVWVARFDPHAWAQAATAGLGVLVLLLVSAWQFGKNHRRRRS